MNRRYFLRISTIVILSKPLFGILLPGCSKDQKQEKDPCSDLKGLSQEQIELRKEFVYVDKTPYPEKRCDNCSLWIIPKNNKPCGGCQLMEGPFHPAGYCDEWISNAEG